MNTSAHSTCNETPSQSNVQKKQRQLNSVKVEYVNYNAGFSWKKLFTWNRKNESFDEKHVDETNVEESKK